MKKCYDCTHVEMCGWRKEVKEQGCEFFSDGIAWIPVSEKLPKAEYGESDCVLATCCWKSDSPARWIEKLYFNGGNWCYPTGECFTQKVVAWMPLPMPYREEGKE